jgi:hypothetical protein
MTVAGEAKSGRLRAVSSRHSLSNLEGEKGDSKGSMDHRRAEPYMKTNRGNYRASYLRTRIEMNIS